jgi:hypothetical protein
MHPTICKAIFKNFNSDMQDDNFDSHLMNILMNNFHIQLLHVGSNALAALLTDPMGIRLQVENALNAKTNKLNESVKSPNESRTSRSSPSTKLAQLMGFAKPHKVKTVFTSEAASNRSSAAASSAISVGNY